MTMRDGDSNIRRPMKPMWITLWVACLLCGVVLFFLIAFLIGLITLGILALIHEEGEVGRDVIL